MNFYNYKRNYLNEVGNIDITLENLLTFRKFRCRYYHVSKFLKRNFWAKMGHQDVKEFLVLSV